MGYVFNYQDAITYEKLLQDPRNQFVSDLQNWLVMDLLKPMKGQSVLGIGCGTGTGLSPFLQMGLQVSGLDPSPYMLDIAEKKLGHRIDFYRGFAENLPFEDNSFNYTCLITALEYVDNPRKTIEEASRVAKDKLFLSVMNRYALNSIKTRIKGVSAEAIYHHARFFSIWEILRLNRMVSGDVPVFWKSISRTPKNRGFIVNSLQHSKVIRWYTFGTFIGIVVVLIPRYQTRPLTIAYSSRP